MKIKDILDGVRVATLGFYSLKIVVSEAIHRGLEGDLHKSDILVGGLVAIFYVPINIGFLSSSQLTKSYFSEGWRGPTTNQ